MRPSPVSRTREADASFLSPAEGDAFLSNLGNGVHVTCGVDIGRGSGSLFLVVVTAFRRSMNFPTDLPHESCTPPCPGQVNVLTAGKDTLVWSPA